MPQANTTVSTLERVSRINAFEQSPDSAIFNEIDIAAVRGCSVATLQRDRWAGAGIPFIKINRAVRYRKSDVIEWLEQFKPQTSTSSAGATI